MASATCFFYFFCQKLRPPQSDSNAFLGRGATFVYPG
nr:MAG TPA: hypothetical protein [Caudoviricetes sp.]